MSEPNHQEKNIPLRQHVECALQLYLQQTSGYEPDNLYNFILNEIETPLLATVMSHTKGNQSKAAIILGISRATLRKKLSLYKISS